MKKIFISNQSQQKLGGGFVFLDNFRKGSRNKCTFVDNWQECDVIFVGSVTQTSRDEVGNAKSCGKKIILRVDNMPKDSRNRGTAFTRMRDFAKLADIIVFQSNWAKEYVGDWIQHVHGVNVEKSPVIYNGVDTEFFCHDDDPKKRGETYLFTTFNTDENKRFPEAAYDFHNRHKKAKLAKTKLPRLRLVGNLGREMPKYNFDFFDGEQIQYSPPVEDRHKMADVYRSCRYLYFPAYADASPNTVAEAIACGCEILMVNPVGGTKEVVEQHSKKTITIQEMADRYLELM